MIVETKQIKSVPAGSSKYEETGLVWYEFRSTTPDPNGSKYLGVPKSIPPSLTTIQIYEIMKAVFPDIKAEYWDEYTQDAAMRRRPQIIWDGYQFLTPRDASMIEAGFFTTLSLHNKIIERLVRPGRFV